MPYKDIEKRREYHRKWVKDNIEKSKEYYQKNRTNILQKKKEYGSKTKDKRRAYISKLNFSIPWRSSYFNAKNRCNNKNGQNYKTYGGRGIKFLINIEEVGEIWVRDRAYEMERPTIDRINNDGNYEFSNCRFIEQSENATKGNLEARWKR
jgi:hypothetical protein